MPISGYVTKKKSGYELTIRKKKTKKTMFKTKKAAQKALMKHL